MPRKKRWPTAPQITVRVTLERIEDSKLRDSSHCMISESVRDSVPWAMNVSTDLQTIRLSEYDKRLRYTYLTPRNAQLALVEFDQGRNPEPFEFTLRAGHVTRMTQPRRSSIAPRGMSEEQQAALSKAAALNPKRNRVRLVPNGGGIPHRVGGATPPTTSFARRRSFGLRALEP